MGTRSGVRAGGMVQLIAGGIVAHPVTTVLGEVELLGDRMPVHADAVVKDAARENFIATAISGTRWRIGVIWQLRPRRGHQHRDA